MHINLINYEAAMGTGGIFTKFANRMHAEFQKMGLSSAITLLPDSQADVNHHIHFNHYRPGGGGVNTLMVTHFLPGQHDKLEGLKRSLETADMGIAFSEHMRAQFIANGIPEEKLTYILPAHDGFARRKRIVTISSRVYGDNRKREWMLTEVSKVIDKDKFAFRIMGEGWQEIVNDLQARGFEVTYFPEFDYNLHLAILDSSDYLLYTGEDEGAMSVLDAANAGVKTIATLQGFHYEIGIDHPFTTQEELNAIFQKLQVNRVADWTWERYAKSHLKVWQDLSKK